MGLLDFIPIVGPIASTVGGAISANKTNKSNMAINQMNNEFNAAEAQKARDFQLDMWNRENEYNTASAQRQRLSEAGLNPYLMMSGGNAGTASSAGSSTPAAAAPPLSMQRQDFSGLTNSLSTALQIANQTKETNARVQNLQGQKSLFDAQANQTLSNIDWFKLGPTYKQWSRETGLMRAGLQFQTDKQQLRNMQWSNNLVKAQRVGQLLDNASKRVINKYLDEGQQLQLNLLASSYYDQMASGHLINGHIIPIASAVGGAVSTNKTNKNNMAINQMNNDFNAAEAQKARDFQLDMWNRENEYNTASAQRQRLSQAGLNPYLMMSGGNAGTASSFFRFRAELLLPTPGFPSIKTLS